MTRSDFETALLALADSLETALPLAITRAEHVRVAAHAREARRLADVFAAAGAAAATPSAA